MKGDRLGEFEELLLLALQALGDRTYGVPVQQHLETITRRSVSMGAVYAALDRLEAKGFVASVVGDATPVRGGKAKRLFRVTRLGRQAALDARKVRERLWRAIEDRR